MSKVIMQGKLFQWCTHLLYCSVLSLGGNVNTQDGCQSLTWDPCRDKRITEIDYQLKYAILSTACSIVYNETQNLQKKD